MYHFIDFFYYIKNKNYKKDESGMIGKYAGYLTKRLLLMQFTVIIGGFLAIASDSPAIGVSLLIILQIWINLKLYFASIKKLI